jgi:hypothetical protein
MPHILPALAIALICIPAFGENALAGLTLNGAAKIVTDRGGQSVILLNPAEQGPGGSVFTTNIIQFNSKYTFSTFFQFRMAHPGGIGAADGIAFVLQTVGPSALGGGGGGLDYNGIAPSVAVEFDTFYNPPFDPNNNHVAILTGGQLNDLDAQSPYGVTNCDKPTGVFGCMANGDAWSVWIDYDGTNLSVAIADKSTTRPRNLITYPIDIPGLLGQDSAYVGFTAGTGNGWESHEIASWRFSETKPPAGLQAR